MFFKFIQALSILVLFSQRFYFIIYCRQEFIQLMHPLDQILIALIFQFHHLLQLLMHQTQKNFTFLPHRMVIIKIQRCKYRVLFHILFKVINHELSLLLQQPLLGLFQQDFGYRGIFSIAFDEEIFINFLQLDVYVRIRQFSEIFLRHDNKHLLILIILIEHVRKKLLVDMGNGEADGFRHKHKVLTYSVRLDQLIHFLINFDEHPDVSLIKSITIFVVDLKAVAFDHQQIGIVTFILLYTDPLLNLPQKYFYPIRYPLLDPHFVFAFLQFIQITHHIEKYRRDLQILYNFTFFQSYIYNVLDSLQRHQLDQDWSHFIDQNSDVRIYLHQNLLISFDKFQAMIKYG